MALVVRLLLSGGRQIEFPDPTLAWPHSMCYRYLGSEQRVKVLSCFIRM